MNNGEWDRDFDKCTCAGSYFGKWCEHEHTGISILQIDLNVFRGKISQFHLYWAIIYWFSIVYEIKDVYKESPCADDFEVEKMISNRSQEVCEQRCTQNSDCSSYFYSENQNCGLYPEECSKSKEIGNVYMKAANSGKKISIGWKFLVN